MSETTKEEPELKMATPSRCLEDTVPLEHIPKVMRKSLRGRYSVGITMCSHVECNFDNGEYPFEYVVGIGENMHGETELMWECPKCFGTNYFHLRCRTWDSFLRYIKADSRDFVFFDYINNEIVRK